jgi:hypothetical protein
VEAVTVARLLTTRPTRYCVRRNPELAGEGLRGRSPVPLTRSRLGATENLEVLNIDRVSVFRLARLRADKIGVGLVGKVRPEWLGV